MNLSRLSSQLRREIKANPGKAALLAGLLVVALYYWIPLVGKWLGGSKDLELVRAQALTEGGVNAPKENSISGGAANPPNLGSGASPNLSPAAQGSGKTPESMPPWDQLVQWRQADPRTRPAPWSADRRDPFQIPSVGSLSEAKDRSPKGKTDRNRSSGDSTDEPPEDFQIELSSIVVGPSRRLALINGRPYQEGDTVVVAKQGQQWQFRLSRILPTGILLQWNDRQYEVSLPRSPSNVEIQTVSTGQTETP